MTRIFTLLLIASFSIANAQTVWTGTPITFTKAKNTDPTMAANQDRITNNVWITRGNKKGIYNIKTEGSYSDFSSPADTEWSLGTTANIASLTFSDWESVASSDPTSLLGLDMVVHLISDDIYIDIKFISWSTGDGSGNGSGGGFSYTRSTDQSIRLTEVGTSQNIVLFPNPAKDHVKISGISEAQEYSIFNVLGSVVKSGVLDNDSEISVENLDNGVYFLQLEAGKTIRFIKK